MTDNDERNIIIQALKKDNAELTKQNYDLMKKYTVKTSDPIINDVIDRIFKRHIQGMEKFKQTMADNPKTADDWTEDIIEELIDAICYLVVRKNKSNDINCFEKIEEVKKEADKLMMNKINYYEKEIALIREQAQIDILTKDQELGRMMKKINELSNGTKKS